MSAAGRQSQSPRLALEKRKNKTSPKISRPVGIFVCMESVYLWNGEQGEFNFGPLRKEIAGWPNYEVLSDGRVWSKKRSRFLKPSDNGKGYFQVGLCQGGEKKMVQVHRLVAQGFIPNPEAKKEVNHISGITSDNRVENLAWVSASENQRHAYKTGLKMAKQGERNGQSKLTEKNIIEIRQRYAAGDIYQYQLAEEFGVSQPLIGHIVRRSSWAHVA